MLIMKIMELESYEELINRLIESIGNENDVKVKLDMGCMDIDGVFKINEVCFEMGEEPDTILIVIRYNVIHCYKDAEIESDIEIESSDKNKADKVFELLWKYKPCPECLFLISKTEDVCKTCLFHKMRQQYGILKEYITNIETCMICQENVYDTKLKCGHWIHHTCLIKMNPERWFDETIELKCPLCREKLTDEDINRYFLTKNWF